MSKIVFSKIKKSFNHVEVVKHVDLTINDKEFFVILGPSGCGKSTLLRMIAGLEEASEGTIYLDNKDITRLSPQKRNVAMVFQNYSLYPHMTVAENIGYPLTVNRENKATISQKVKEIAKIVSIDHLLDRIPGQLSGGQRQRVALARSIIREPEAFLMDEPLSNLDALLRTTTRRELKKLHHSLETTIVYVTHDQIEAMTLADRIIIMNKGVIQQLGSPREIYEKPENCFVANFIGTPAMNLVRGNIKDNYFISENIKFPVQSDIVEDIFLGIRPENVHICNKQDNYHIEAKVFNYEYLGEHSEITILINGTPFVVRAPSEIDYELDTTVYLKIDSNKTHFFDGITEQRIKIQ